MTHRPAPASRPQRIARWLLAAGLTGLPIAPAFPGVTGRLDADALITSRLGPRSYPEIAAAVMRDGPCRILRIRLIRRGGRMVYLVRVLKPDGKRRDIVLDSVTLAVIEK